MSEDQLKYMMFTAYAIDKLSRAHKLREGEDSHDGKEWARHHNRVNWAEKEIKTLRAENARLREALSVYVRKCDSCGGVGVYDAPADKLAKTWREVNCEICHTARQALKAGEAS